MKKMMKRLLTTLVIFALVFTCIPAISGTLEADAAAKPSPVNSIKLKSYGMHEITVSWGKAKKNVNGYTIYRDGKVLKHVGKSVISYKNTGLQPDTKYSYYVRAYRNVKQKQWFNKKTGKWQTKKPAKKIRGKSRKVTVKLYGRSSPKQSIRTGKPSENLSETEQVTYKGPGLKMDYGANSVTAAIELPEGYEPDSKITISCEGLETVTLDAKNKDHTFEGLSIDTTYNFKAIYYYAGKVRKTSENPVTTGRKYNLKAEPDFKTIKLSWTSYEGDRSYKLTKSCGGVTIFEDKEIASSEYIDTEVEKGKVYNYTLKVEDKDKRVHTLAVSGCLLSK